MSSSETDCGSSCCCCKKEHYKNVLTNNEEIKNSGFYGPLPPAGPQRLLLRFDKDNKRSDCEAVVSDRSATGCLRSIVYHADSNLSPTC